MFSETETIKNKAKKSVDVWWSTDLRLCSGEIRIKLFVHRNQAFITFKNITFFFIYVFSDRQLDTTKQRWKESRKGKEYILRGLLSVVTKEQGIHTAQTVLKCFI